MAIFSFYQCQILVNGVALQEYNDDEIQKGHQSFPIVTRYVEAASGAEFIITFSLLPERVLDEDLVWTISLDGTTRQCAVVDNSKLRYGFNIWTRDGVQVGRDDDWYLKKYKFADIVMGDTADNLKPEEIKAKYSSLGLIRIEVWRFRIEHTESVHKSAAMFQGPGPRTIPEKVLKGKALSLSTSLGDPVWIGAVQQAQGKYLGLQPLVAFDFLYRSKAALQQLMIIPRSPTPVPLEARAIEDLTADEARELLRRQRAKADAVVIVKTESSPKLKRDRSATTTDTRPVKIVRMADGRECIDLASDSEDSGEEEEAIVLGKIGKKADDAEIEVVNLLE